MRGPRNASTACGRVARGAAALALLAAASGCASLKLESARRDFWEGRLAEADAALADTPGARTDEVLVLMERGTIRQAQGRYRDSAMDWMRAAQQADHLDYLSLSRSVASMATSDRVLAFRGMPFERTLLHAFSAKNYLALGEWDGAGVEARNIIERLQEPHGFPDDAYSRYMAGFGLELTGDSDGAARQYREADRLAAHVSIDPDTGWLSPAGTNEAAARPPRLEGNELVCFIGLRRTGFGLPGYAELYTLDGRFLGRSYRLADRGRLLADTQRRVAALRATKDVTRVVLKEVAAYQVARRNEGLGLVLWLILFAFEGQKDRQWETLPHALHVARVPCPDELAGLRVVFRGPGGAAYGEKTFSRPLARRGNTFVSFCRDVP